MYGNWKKLPSNESLVKLEIIYLCLPGARSRVGFVVSLSARTANFVKQINFAGRFLVSEERIVG